MILLVLLLFVFTLELVFQGSFNLNMVTIVEALSLPYYVLDIALNFILIKSFSGRKLTKLKEIGLHYLTKFFAVDSACVLILLLDLAISSSLLQVLRLIFIAKIPQCMDKIEKL